MLLDSAVVGLYVLGMLGVGWFGMRLARTRSDYLVAGRRLGWFLYSGTMAAVVLGGASTIGGVGLGYTYGVSGAWLVVTIGLGILVLHWGFARRLVRLRVYTVPEMLGLRYGGSPTKIAGIVMWGYTLMLTVTSLLAFASVMPVLFDLPGPVGIALGGAIVVLYSALGGMWSVTLTDIVQFVITTIGVLFVLLPVVWFSAGGLGGLTAELGAQYFRLDAIGGATIVAYVLTYGFGLLIGQDIWQRVFTARSPRVAAVGGTVAGAYCLVYGFAGALIGTAARVLYPGLSDPDSAFATAVEHLLPPGVRGLVLAAALSALMSTASGALIACSAISTTDLLALVRRQSSERAAVSSSRWTTVVLGAAAIAVAMFVGDVVAALTVAYNLLVGGLLVPVLGGLVWRRGTRAGALWSIVAGSIAVLASMITWGMQANEPIYFGLAASLVTFVAVSAATPPTPDDVLRDFDERLHGDSRTEPTRPDPEGTRK